MLLEIFIGVLVLRAGVAGVCIPFTDRSDIFSRDDYSTLFSEKKMKCSIAASGFSGGMWIS